MGQPWVRVASPKRVHVHARVRAQHTEARSAPHSCSHLDALKPGQERRQHGARVRQVDHDDHHRRGHLLGIQEARVALRQVLRKLLAASHLHRARRQAGAQRLCRGPGAACARAQAAGVIANMAAAAAAAAAAASFAVRSWEWGGFV